jgi:polyisoprenoid-binding protein YceI
MELSRIFLACGLAAVSLAASAVTVSGPGTYTLDAGTLAVGETVTLTAVPDSGNAFFRWTGDIGNADPAEATITFTVPDGSIGALFGNEAVL